MKTTVLAFLLLVALTQAAAPEPKHWRDLLSRPVDDHWQQIVGLAISQHEARPAETFAGKISAIQALIAKSNKAGLTVPVFLSPELAVRRFEAIPATPPEQTRTGVPLIRVPALELFRYIGGLSGCDVIETKQGIILRPFPKK